MGGVCSVARSIEVVDVAIHPKFDGLGHDIAVLTLGSDAPYTGKLKLVIIKI